jgi:hypothetical protein
MIDIVGYLGLVLNLLSMTMKEVLYLRILALLANTIYIIYGLLLQAVPFIIGCTVAVAIHAYYIHKTIHKRGSDKIKL